MLTVMIAVDLGSNLVAEAPLRKTLENNDAGWRHGPSGVDWDHALTSFMGKLNLNLSVLCTESQYSSVKTWTTRLPAGE